MSALVHIFGGFWAFVIIIVAVCTGWFGAAALCWHTEEKNGWKHQSDKWWKI